MERKRLQFECIQMFSFIRDFRQMGYFPAGDASDRLCHSRDEPKFFQERRDVFPWDDVQMQYTDSVGDLHTITGIPDELIPSNLYMNRTMVTWTAAGHAFTGNGMRVFTFAQPGDTLVIK